MHDHPIPNVNVDDTLAMMMTRPPPRTARKTRTRTVQKRRRRQEGIRRQNGESCSHNQVHTVSHLQVLPRTHIHSSLCMHSIPPAPSCPTRRHALPRACNLITYARHTVTPRLALKITRAVALVHRFGTKVRFSWCFHCTDYVDRVGAQPQRRHQGRPPAPVSKTRSKDNHPTSSLTTTRAPTSTSRPPTPMSTHPPLSASFCWSFGRVPRAMTTTTTAACPPAPAPSATMATAMTSRQHPHSVYSSRRQR